MKRGRSRRPYVLALSYVALAASGCAHTPPPAPAAPVEPTLVRAEGDQVIVGAAPIFDSQDSQRRLSADYPSRGILPVYVTVENRSLDRVYEVTARQFSLRDSQSGKVQAVWTGDHGNVADLLTAPLFIALGATTERKPEASPTKELDAIPIGPGRTKQGFVFFRVASDRTGWPSHWTLQYQPQLNSGPTFPPIAVNFSEPTAQR